MPPISARPISEAVIKPRQPESNTPPWPSPPCKCRRNSAPPSSVHGEGAEQEGTRAQAQAGEQARQAGHGPGDGGAVDGRAERCDQVEKPGRRPPAKAGRPAPSRPARRRRATQLPEAEQRRRTEHQRAQWRTLQQRRLTRAHAIQVGQRRTALQQQGEEPRQAALLVQAEPADAGALDGPVRPRSSARPCRAEWPGCRRPPPAPQISTSRLVRLAEAWPRSTRAVTM